METLQPCNIFCNTARNMDPIENDIKARRIALGLTIHHRRKALRLRLIDVAAATGFSLAKISRIENGQERPRVEDLETFARAFGCNVCDLLP